VAIEVGGNRFNFLISSSRTASSSSLDFPEMLLLFDIDLARMISALLMRSLSFVALELPVVAWLELGNRICTWISMEPGAQRKSVDYLCERECRV